MNVSDRSPDLVVVSALKAWSCAACGNDEHDLLKMEDRGPVCLECADLGHLVFLARGNTALTRRARKHSALSAVVVRFSRARGRYERQGVLVDQAALERAAGECLSDADLRARRREQQAEQRARGDLEFQRALGDELRRLFPGAPVERLQEIARHTGARGSGRVGRTAAARAFDEDAITLAVAAAIRHRDTDYDDRLMAGVDRMEARASVRATIDETLGRWRRPAEDAHRRGRGPGKTASPAS